MAPTPRRLYTRTEVAGLYGISLATLYRWVGTEQIPGPIPDWPGYPRWDADEIDALLTGQATA